MSPIPFDAAHEQQVSNIATPDDPRHALSKSTNYLTTPSSLVCVKSEISSPERTLSHAAASSSPCQCIHVGIRVLEGLQIIYNKSIPSAFDRIPRLKKQAIDKCMSIMRCQDCIRTSPMVMLLLVICEKLVSSFENWSKRYKGRNPSGSRSSGSKGDDAKQSQSQLFFLGVYEVDAEEERCSLLRALAMVQLRRLILLLAELMSMARYQNWTEHQTILRLLIFKSEDAASGLIARF